MSKHIQAGPQMPLHQPDYLSHQGASQLVARIHEYWARQGRTVCVWVEEISGFSSSQSTKRNYAVRSDMVGGQPCDRFTR